MICAYVWSKPLLGVKLITFPVAVSRIACPAFTSTTWPLGSRRCQKMPTCMTVDERDLATVLMWSTSLRLEPVARLVWVTFEVTSVTVSPLGGARKTTSAVNVSSRVKLHWVPLTFLTGFFGMDFGVLVKNLNSPWAFVLLGLLLPAATVAMTLLLNSRLLRRLGVGKLTHP